jgi:anhydro-N-acetylmuramic acid kinase
MVMDQIAERITAGRQRFDRDGLLAARGVPGEGLLAWMLSDPWLRRKPPKSTGREAYGAAYTDAVMERGRAAGLSDEDILATATRFTAECICVAVRDFCPVPPQLLIVGGGGSRNPTLMRYIRDALTIPVLRNEDLGYDSDAKEAVAFAILANECIHGQANNMVSVTGAKHPIIMGKITL